MPVHNHIALLSLRQKLHVCLLGESITGHLSRARAHEILVGAFSILKLDGASTHSMRRSCPTYMSRVGTPLRTIQEISGHSNLGQLQAYLEVDPEDKHRAINLLRY